jgi:hypothetical protein
LLCRVRGLTIQLLGMATTQPISEHVPQGDSRRAWLAELMPRLAADKPMIAAGVTETLRAEGA